MMTIRRAWVRWTQQQLDTVKALLEHTSTGKFGAEKARVAAEWIINRYLPDGAIRHEDEYRHVIQKLDERIRHNIAHQESPEPYVASPSVTYQHFETLIAPHLRTLGTIPGKFHEADTKEFLVDLFRLSSDRSTTSWQKQSFMFGKYATENLDFLVMAISASSAIHAYETLLEVKHQGYTRIKGVSAYSNACDVCKREISGQIFLIDDLLEAYRSPQQDSVIIPHSHCEQNALGGWCRCGWVRVSDTPPGVDPKFEKWLDAQLGRAQKEAFAEGARAASKLKKHRGS